jgi:hypothetical protein
LRFSWQWLWRMPSSGILHLVADVRIDVSEKCIPSMIRLTRTSELGKMLAITNNQSIFLHSMLQLLVTASIVPSSLIHVTLMMEAIHSSQTSVLTRATWHNISEDSFLYEYHACLHCRTVTWTWVNWDALSFKTGALLDLPLMWRGCGEKVVMVCFQACLNYLGDYWRDWEEPKNPHLSYPLYSKVCKLCI